MSRCLSLTRAGEYAIASLSRLALAPAGAAAVSVETLAASQKIPAAYLSKILSQCAKAGLLRMRKGPRGGVALARPPESIALLEIAEACEGTLARDLCVFYPSRRCDGPACPVYCPLRRDEEEVRLRLRRTTLAQMAESLRAHPDAGLADARPADVTGGY